MERRAMPVGTGSTQNSGMRKLAVDDLNMGYKICEKKKRWRDGKDRREAE